MVVRKFFAASTREALRLVRDALGADALILSNRQVPGGIEIMAVAEHDLTTATVAALNPSPAGHSAPPLNGASRPSKAREPAMPTPAPITTEALAKEVHALRDLVEGQLATFAWREFAQGSPARAELMRELMSRGFSAGFSRLLASKLPRRASKAQALRWVKSVLVANLHCVGAGEDIVSRGGVYALVGPTGVGKTTTVAKLAASCTLQHGPAQLALVTTDSYRIGAIDQLRIYGKILGVPVFAAKDEQDLAVTLAELRGRKLVLIDTVGMSQRDRRVTEQVAQLCGSGSPVQRLLLLSAVAQPEALEDTVRRYGGRALAGCILTKIDEAMSLGGALDVIVRSRLRLHYVANGQRVPEDLHLASPLYLVERAFRNEPPPAAFRSGPEEAAIGYAARSRAAAVHGG
jgi:flagellar biosynthesis protein FlhF